MKTLFAILVATSMAVSFSVAAFGQGASTGSQTTVTDRNRLTAAEKKTESNGNEFTYAGEIVKLNTADQTIVVRGKEGEKTFDMSRATAHGSITTGHTVRVTYYTDKKGNLIASSMTGSMKMP